MKSLLFLLNVLLLVGCKDGSVMTIEESRWQKHAANTEIIGDAESLFAGHK